MWVFRNSNGSHILPLDFLLRCCMFVSQLSLLNLQLDKHWTGWTLNSEQRWTRTDLFRSLDELQAANRNIKACTKFVGKNKTLFSPHSLFLHHCVFFSPKTCLQHVYIFLCKHTFLKWNAIFSHTHTKKKRFCPNPHSQRPSIPSNLHFFFQSIYYVA